MRLADDSPSSAAPGAPRGAAVVVAVGLLLAVAALLERRGGGDPAPSVRLTFTVPEALIVASAAVFLLAGLVIIVAARGRRKPEEDEPEPVRQRVPLPWWGHALVQIALLVPFIAVVVVLWADGGRVAGALLAFGRSWFDPTAANAAAETPVVSLPWLGWTLGLIALGIALATLAIALLLLFAERLLRWWMARHATTEDAELVAAIDDSLDDLADESDPRVAIIRCYRRFEHAAARAQVRRDPWQTPAEFMLDARRRLPLPALAVERLTSLFEIARFSHHPVRTADRDLARRCLEEIRAALDRREDRVGVA